MSIAIWWFAFVLVVVLVGLFLGLTQRATPQDPRGNEWGAGTRFFLVTLRLAIGWHFLFEGIEKLHSPSWSSEGYLREASGPLASKFRALAGDGLAARLTPGSDGSFPAELNRDWQAYLNNFIAYYHLNDDQAQRAKATLDKEEAKTKTWLATSKKPVKLVSPYPPPVDVEKTIPQRIQEYQAYEQKAREIEDSDLPVYGSVVHGKLLDAKKEANRMRAELRSDLAKQTADMRKALRGLLTPEQKEMGPPPEAVKRPVAEWGLLEWTDAVVTYGLLAVGAGLILGVMTRLACLGGAMFLLMFYLAMPAIPGWPESPKLEGHYFYINKTFIEALALLALATTRSGRWLGLDGLLQFLSPRAWRSTPQRGPVEHSAFAGAATKSNPT
jgi:uncharacterized membrane protein YphA (DoxX/SURF4 family)